SSTSNPVPAIFKRHEGVTRIEFNDPEYGISPGQACVFYESDKSLSRVLGGGWIIKDKNNTLN
ncbi:MAG: aminomethyltransferase beta-barrel domain-containing protein, partial [Hyphomicrobiales bacterium]